MAVQIAPVGDVSYKFSIAQFEQMISEGIFAEEERVVLIDGEIIEIMPINHPRAAVVSNLEFILRERLGRSAYVWAQQPLVLNSRSRPQPDVTVLRWRDDRYIPAPPTAQDVLLLIEVADTSLAADRSWKRDKYAAAGIPEYWVVNIQARQVEVFSGPASGKYKSSRVAGRGESLQVPGAGDVSLTIEEIFGLA
jgi:Uma2 family endonuclease